MPQDEFLIYLNAFYYNTKRTNYKFLMYISLQINVNSKKKLKEEETFKVWWVDESVY